mmetsp:Transcript_9615/g.18459  ORF Transcript_9615/g.18459 Transcript_9615/m.18459 type:complete len:277 (+) Transcript_9615:76-906(+)
MITSVFGVGDEKTSVAKGREKDDVLRLCVLFSPALSSSSSSSSSSSVVGLASLVEEIKGYESFVRHNPMSDKFGVLGFDHVEFWCGDALAVANTWKQALGMRELSRSDLSTGNNKFCSIVIGSNDVKMAFTSPYPTNIQDQHDDHTSDVDGVLGFDSAAAHDFIIKHGTAVRAIGLRVEDVHAAYEIATTKGNATGITKPTLLQDHTNQDQNLLVCELGLYGDVVLRLISDTKPTTTTTTTPRCCAKKKTQTASVRDARSFFIDFSAPAPAFDAPA